jgi:hypothetical protein
MTRILACEAAESGECPGDWEKLPPAGETDTVGQGALRASMSCFGIRAVLSAAAYRTLIQVPVQVPIPSKCQSTDRGTFPETKLVLSLGYGFQSFIAGQAFGRDYPGKQADPFQMPPCGHTVLENYPRHV